MKIVVILAFFGKNREIFCLGIIFVVFLCFEIKCISDAEIVVIDKGFHQRYDYGSGKCVPCVEWYGFVDTWRVRALCQFHQGVES